tara:strand:+ start:1402 stop:1761 length:360 start_codon:yes stop_codon:yes gene_type:complete
MLKTSEKQVMKAITELLESKYRNRVSAWRNNTGTAFYENKKGSRRRVSYGLKGSSDYIGLIKPTGRFLGIEAKGDDGKQRKEQSQFADMITDYGGIYILAYSADTVEQVLDRYLQSLGK